MNLDTAEKLFSQGKFEEAHESAFDVFREDKTNCEALLLAFKSYLMTFSPEEARNATETERGKFLLQMAEALYCLAKTPEELFDLEEKVIRATYEWKKHMTLSLLDRVERYRTFSVWKEYYEQFLHYAMFTFSIGINVYSKPAQVFQLNADKIEEYRHKTEDSFIKSERYEFETEMVERVLNSIQQTISNNSSGSSEVVAKKIISDLLLIECVANSTLDGKKEAQSTSILSSLKNSARVKEMILNAKVGYMFHKITLFTGYADRKKKIDQLKAVYDEIKEIDPSFSAPALPKADEPATKAGCYVATAVYGSYDCPQVWVLRRFRDYYLGESWFGRLFIKVYYGISPTLVKWFGKRIWFRKIFIKKLDRLVSKLQNKGIEATPYQDRVW